MKSYIKNMVCIRCKMVVKSELEKLGLHNTIVELGEAVIREDISSEQLDRLNTALKKSGLELMDDKKSILVEKIKAVIIGLVHYNEEQIKINLSDYLSEKLNHNYSSPFVKSIQENDTAHPISFQISKADKTQQLRKCVNDVIYFQSCVTISEINRRTFVLL